MNANKITSLQVYRGIAAILVMLYHVTDQSPSKFGVVFLQNSFLFGFIGVDFFFVLSGFIILYVHNQNIGNPKELRSYLIKRFIRLFPIYWSVAFIKIVTIYLIPSSAKSYETDLLYILKSLLLIPQDKLPIIGAAWSLSYEILFYLLFGIVILIGFRWAHRLLLVWVVAIIGFWGLRFIQIPIFENSLFISFLLKEQNLEFIFGCLAAYLLLNKEIKYSGIIMLGGGLLFSLWCFVINNGNQVFSYTLTVGFAAFLLILGSALTEKRKYIKWPKILVFLGDASYSIYLTHVMFINIFTIVFLKVRLPTLIGSLPTILLILVLSITGGSLVYIFWERTLIIALRNRFIKSAVKQKSVLPVSP